MAGTNIVEPVNCFLMFYTSWDLVQPMKLLIIAVITKRDTNQIISCVYYVKINIKDDH